MIQSVSTEPHPRKRRGERSSVPEAGRARACNGGETDRGREPRAGGDSTTPAACTQPPPRWQVHHRVNFGFIVGMPRSGTTLAAKMIAAHPEAAVTRETHLLSNSRIRSLPPGPAGGERLIRALLSAAGPHVDGPTRWVIEKTPRHIEALDVIRRRSRRHAS